MEINVTKDNFENEVLFSEKPVLVDFWASWCGPCRMLAPVLTQISTERMDFKVAKVNVDEERDLAKQYGIMSIPTLIIFNQGKIINQISGFMTKDDLNNLLNSALEKTNN